MIGARELALFFFLSGIMGSIASYYQGKIDGRKEIVSWVESAGDMFTPRDQFCSTSLEWRQSYVDHLCGN